MPNRLDRRSFLARSMYAAAGVAGLGGLPVLLDACGSSAQSGVSGSANGGASSLPPRRGGKVIVSVTSEVDGFDPTKSHFDATGIMYAQTVFDPLAIATADGGVKPYLAQSIVPSQNYTVWTIQLRPGVIFHDGTPLDADAAMLNFDKQLSSFLTSLALKNVDHAMKVDDMTVALVMKEPWVPFPYYLGGFYIGGQLGFMAAPKMLNSSNGANQPIGTGPFVFKEWVPNDHFTATRNPHYWRNGLPYLDEIEYRPIIDQSAQGNSIRAGTVDVLTTGFATLISELQTDSSLEVVDDRSLTVGEPDMDSIMLNTVSAPLDDVRVRRALAFATNSQQETNVINSGLNPVSTGPFPSGPNHAASGYPSYDPAEARRLVSQYEREKGRIEFNLGTTPSGTDLEEVSLLQQQWKAIGITTNLQQIEQSQFINNALLGQFQAYTWTQFAAPDPDLNYLWWSTTTAAPIGQISINFSRNHDPELQAGLDAGRTSSDPTARANAYQSVARRLAQDVPYLWLDRSVSAVVSKPHVMNYNNFVLPDGSKGWPARALMFPIVQMWVNA